MSIRKQVLALADNRALEEQAERTNPVAPSLRGKGATPSMGLSQFRGGAKRKSAKALNQIIDRDEAESPSQYLEEADAMAEMPSGEYDGGARQQGMALGKHLLSLRGGAFHKAFMEGMGMSGGAMSGGGVMVGAGVNTGRYEGEGKLEIVHHGEEEECGGARSGGARSGGARSGGARSGGAKPKRVVAESDGRRKRAEIVRRVMAEKGLSMIQASKYVKEHGLY